MALPGRQRALETDVAEAVADRIGRQGYLLQRGRQFVFLIEEPVLRFRPYGLDRPVRPAPPPADRHAAAVGPVGRYLLGRRPAWPAARESFDITDSLLVTVEILAIANPDRGSTVASKRVSALTRERG